MVGYSRQPRVLGHVALHLLLLLLLVLPAHLGANVPHHHARFYDTQCGAKIFRATPLLRATLGEEFHSRWAFDVELIGRMLTGAGGLPPILEEDFLEVPLRSWVDVGGSKLGMTSMARVTLDLAVIANLLQKRRREQGR